MPIDLVAALTLLNRSPFVAGGQHEQAFLNQPCGSLKIGE
jgi:hypothetical protein